MNKKLKIINEFSPVIKPLSAEDWQLLQDFDAGDKKYAFNIFIKFYKTNAGFQELDSKYTLL